jgi:hypothetical protein
MPESICEDWLGTLYRDGSYAINALAHMEFLKISKIRVEGLWCQRQRCAYKVVQDELRWLWAWLSLC